MLLLLLLLTLLLLLDGSTAVRCTTPTPPSTTSSSGSGPPSVRWGCAAASRRLLALPSEDRLDERPSAFPCPDCPCVPFSPS
uniref:Putative secreted protein n=1 Tax=Anopheles darlingi TaxID=43151 RepID=A0A2M4D437_ANODA